MIKFSDFIVPQSVICRIRVVLIYQIQAVFVINRVNTLLKIINRRKFNYPGKIADNYKYDKKYTNNSIVNAFYTCQLYDGDGNALSIRL